MGSEMPEMLTVDEAAATLRVTAETVRRWLRDGRIRGVRLGGRKAGWRIPAGEVRRLLEPAPAED